MNIFLFDLDHATNAAMHCKKHLTKMPLEYAQILSTVKHLHSCASEELYKPTHTKHPCTLWAAASPENYNYLWKLFNATLLEFEVRRGKKHACSKLLAELAVNPWKQNAMDSSGIPKQFAQAMPEALKNADAVQAYQNYFNAEKQHIAEWECRSVPYWYKEVT